ncbi:MAG: hypothetical protein HS129_15165 [Leptospiraceae bacterium]|nr:hypothetical protein [Leptospiraceae bacterium]NUM41344.1 hypothetical protein [Leptospiraceae bacterium]
MKNLNEEYDKEIQYRDSKKLRFKFRKLEDSLVSHIFELKGRSKNGELTFYYETGKSLCNEVSKSETVIDSERMDDQECWEAAGLKRPNICGTCMSHYSAYDVS